MIRVTVGVEAHTHEFIATAHEDQKFGFSIAAARQRRRRGGPPGARRPTACALVGLHSHIGSQIFDTEGFEVAAHRVVRLLAELHKEHGDDALAALTTLDLGGGFGIAYRADDDPLDVAELAERAARASSSASATPPSLDVPQIAVEPGRAIAGPGTVTLYEVGTLKDVPLDGGSRRRYVSVDGGMSDNIRTALYDARLRLPAGLARLRAATARRGGAVPRGRQALRERRHRGARLLAARRPRPGRPARGRRDRRLLLLDGQLYNRLPRPAVVAVRDGAARVLLRRETDEDQFRLEVSQDEPSDDGANGPGMRPDRSRCWAAARSAREVVRLLREQADDLAARIGAPVELVGRRRAPAAPAPATTPATCSPPTPPRWSTRDDVDVVVEVIGGIEPARTLLLEALKAGKSVVTANKALLAEDGAALAEAADASGADLYYEASVAGAIPLLRPLRESLAGDRITRVTGIVNGTTNFILSAMAATGAELRRRAGGGHPARVRRGRPERRRRRLRRRVQGRDPGRRWPSTPGSPPPTCTARASAQVTAADIAAAKGLGCTIKLLAICERTAGDGDEPESVVGPGPPGDDPAHRTRSRPSTARSTRSSSRPRPRVS